MKIRSRKLLLGFAAAFLSGTMVFSAVLPNGRIPDLASAEPNREDGAIRNVTGKIETHIEDYFDESVTQKLPETVSPDQEISVLVYLDTDTLLDAYEETSTDRTVGEFAVSAQGKAVTSRIEKESKAIQNRLKNAGVSFEVGNSYDTFFGGFEAIIRANEFKKLSSALQGRAGAVVSEVYLPCETKVVGNDVNVDDRTGIFDSSDSDYDGSGTVIAVVDTGLDYTHSAFDVANFTAPEEQDSITLDGLHGLVDDLAAAVSYPGLTEHDVYLSRKVPYAFDYADHDPNVYPINSEHGTHVAGVMVGLDNEIRGVAPNAQLAVMKVFSESDTGARQSWIIAALQDCVKLNVDVINMSLGTSCGFSREVDEVARQDVYDQIAECGISLVAAASNDYNSTFGSEKNGNLGLTSNPDSATVGSPSTYEAALSVASISGVRTPYLLFNGSVMYFTESSDRASEPKKFVEDLLGSSAFQATYGMRDEVTLEYVVIPGVGREADYNSAGEDVTGKIAVVSRGQTNFEEKARIAQRRGALACIIYNNVSGDISMTVGNTDFPVCSVSQDDGKLLTSAAEGSRKLTISRAQTAGPFMSDFSSWGPSPDLGIKPEITAHGGDIYSAVPGQSYDRLSGTSMASPNQAGVTALVRQYVKATFPDYDNKMVAATVNQIMMSTTDIALNTNGLPFSVRKQGSGLANLGKATSSPAFIKAYKRGETAGTFTDEFLDKAKIELGDDPQRTGIYTLKFDVYNFGDSTLSYQVTADVLTEGVSETITTKGDQFVDQKGYRLEGASVVVTDVVSGSHTDNTITVGAKQSATVTVVITLGDSDREYLEKNFKNGMYVEGFVKLAAADGNAVKVDLSAPYLAFYGSWAAAPMFDLDYFATNKDELDDSIDLEQKTLPDAYATRPIGGLYNDYIVYLGSYSFTQDPASTNKISADREHIALTNQGGEFGGVNSINSIYCGLLRNAKRMVMTITDTVTGEVIFRKTEYNQLKSYNHGGAIGPSLYDVQFNVADYDLKNNTKYMVTLTGYLDYGDGSVERNTFEFPFYTDFEAPIVTGVTYSYEYDMDAKKNRLFANIEIYDNHYVQAMQPGYIIANPPGSEYLYTLEGFGRYLTPVIGGRNTTSTVQFELTDYLEKIKANSYTGNSFFIQVMDYASNTAVFEINIPDKVKAIAFEEEEIRISPNETRALEPTVLPSEDEAWRETLNYTVLVDGVENDDYVRVVAGKLVGVQPTEEREVTVVATSNENPNIRAEVKVVVLGEGDEGYQTFNKPVAESFRLTGYTTNKVFYFMSGSDCELGTNENGDEVQFSSNYYSLRMFPSESVTLEYELNGYFDSSEYLVEFSSSDEKIVRVSQDGTIEARNEDADGNALNSERSATVFVRLKMKDANGEFANTIYSQTVNITVKEAYTTNGPYLMSYMGLGGRVVIPADFGVTEINQYAFSNYTYIPKDLAAGDVIDEEDPYSSKIWYIGENTIQEVVIPEGVEVIGPYAFANLTALRKVVFPSTLKKIQNGAFYNCTALTTVEFNDNLNNLQFVNEHAFENCSMLTNFPFDSIIAFGDYAFAYSALVSVRLPDTAQSIGAYAFLGNNRLNRITIDAETVKVGAGAFAGCTLLSSIEVNTAVLPDSTFEGCENLTSFTIGKDVSVLGQYAFAGTSISSIEVDEDNRYFESKNGQYIVNRSDGSLALVAPATTDFTENTITKIALGAFSAATDIKRVTMTNVKEVGDYAFAGCSELTSVRLGKLEKVGAFAFYRTGITTLPEMEEGVTIGEYAFAGRRVAIDDETIISISNKILSVTIPARAEVGMYAFAWSDALKTVEVKEGAVLGEGVFYSDPRMATVTIGNGVTIGASAFAADSSITLLGSIFRSETTYLGYPVYVAPYLSGISSLTIGDNVVIGDYAFLGAGSGEYSSGEGSSSASYGARLTTVSLGGNAEIGDYAFFAASYLSDIDLSKAKSIGEAAFSGTLDGYISTDSGLMSSGLVASAPKLTSVTLTEAESVGPLAFAYESELKTVNLGSKIDTVETFAFRQATSLETINLNNIGSVGVGAFYLCDKLGSVTLKSGASVLEYAFYGCSSLTTVGNLAGVVYVGDSAFENTLLTAADLSSAKHIGSFAFRGAALSSVKLGDALLTVGENPFVGCDISFVKEEGGEKIDTYDIGTGTVKIIGGVMYRDCAGGLELICYPGKKAETVYTVDDATVRIGAQAFAQTDIASVELPRKLGSIGDRAFYGCEHLAVVVFRSIEAPVLEEAYDNSYTDGMDAQGIPFYIRDAVGRYYLTNGSAIGLEIVDYRIWNADPTGVLYGANFIDRIGSAEGRANHLQKTLIMIRPANGSGYETFTYGQYFDAVFLGMTTPTDETLEVIRLIGELPSSIRLSDEEQVVALRNRYDALSRDQQALVENYGVLTAAENTIEYLKSNETPPDTPPETPTVEESVPGWIVALCISFGVVAVIAIAADVVLLLFLLKKKSKGKEDGPDENAEESDPKDPDGN